MQIIDRSVTGVGFLKENNMPLCTLCPRNCRIDRSKTTGACSVKGLKTAKASLHFGEEPCISGTDGRGAGTIFFSGCSLKCIFCQNMPISRDGYGKEITPERLGEIMLEFRKKVRITLTL